MTESTKSINKICTEDNYLTVPLFHGTSTLFLDSIIKNGIGAINPIKEWGLLELSIEVYYLSEKYLQETHLFKLSSGSFKNMIEQSNKGSFNFQHGDTYLSPSKVSACRYAISMKYGSEILTYTFNFLGELFKNDIPDIKGDLMKRFPRILGLMETRPSPILIKISNVNTNFLLDEKGDNPKKSLEKLQGYMDKGSDFYQLVSEQTNFRLIDPVQSCNLSFYLINIHKIHNIWPEYSLYKFQTIT